MGDRVTRHIKHGVVLVEVEESVLLVKYDMEQVCRRSGSSCCCYICCCYNYARLCLNFDELVLKQHMHT
jgi:hypothetical protein